MTRIKIRRRIAVPAAVSIQPILPPPPRTMPPKLVRKTANGDLLLEGLPVYIAGSVATKADLPASGEAVGESYIIGNTLLGIWTGKQWLVIGSTTTDTSS